MDTSELKYGYLFDRLLEPKEKEMACKHERLTIRTVEEVSQRYYLSEQEWGDVLAQDVIELVHISCADCENDLTEELKDKIDLSVPIRVKSEFA